VVNYLASESQKNDGVLEQYLLAHTDVLHKLWNLAVEPHGTHDAFALLVNLTRNGDLALLLATESHVASLCALIKNPNATTSERACMLLANLTLHHTAPCEGLLLQQNGGQSRLLTLVDVFAKGKAHNQAADCHHLALVFANVTRLDQPRTHLLPALTSLIPALHDPRVLVRNGIASTLKNCCFETSQHPKLISQEVGLVLNLMISLALATDLRENVRKRQELRAGFVYGRLDFLSFCCSLFPS